MHVDAIKIYKSSAGSGKTFALVLEYLTILLKKPTAYRELLAVTFTNKATNEMKRRIIAALATFSRSDLSDLKRDPLYLELHLRLSKIDSEAATQIQERSAYALEEILSDYANFSVSTIESFFQRVVRAFARELNLPMGYDIQTEMEVVKEQIVQELYLDIGERAALTELFNHFLISNMNEEKSWDFDPSIKRIGTELFKEAFQRRRLNRRQESFQLQSILELAKKIQRIKFQFENQVKGLGKKGMDIMDRYNLSVDDFKNKNRGVAGYITKIALSTSSTTFLPHDTARKALEDEHTWYTKKSDRKDDIVTALSNGLNDALEELIEYVDEHYPLYQSSLSAYRNLYSFGMMNDLAEKLNEYRKEQNEMIISDTSFLLHTIVNDADDELGLLTPFIYEKVGVRYQYYLLDEFQDTSEMQWENLFPLMVEAIAKADKLTRVGIMGDVKQSIYRWRNGRMQLLLHEVEDQVARITGQAAAVVALDNNWRTAQEIVHFNNQFFPLAANLLASKFNQEDHLFSEAYANVIQQAQRKEYPGFVSIKAFPEPNKKQSKEGSPSWKEQAKEACYLLICELFEAGFKGEDIVLLMRKNGDGIMMAEYLQARKVQVVSAESLLLAKHPQVQFYLSFFQYLLRPDLAIHKKSVQYFFALLSGTHVIDHSLFAQELDMLWKLVHRHDENLQRLPIYELAEYIRQLFPFLRESNAYLQGLMDTIWEYSARFDASLSGFLAWWDEIKGKRAIVTAAEPEAVQIMTIHKAKGLEFPIVILPLADWDLEPEHKDILWVQTPENTIFDVFPYLPINPSSKLKHTYFEAAFEEERTLSYLDNLNLLYVAFTRPKYQLHILTKESKVKSEKEVKSISTLLTHIIHTEEVEGERNTSPLQFSCGVKEHAPNKMMGAIPQKRTEPIRVNHIAGIGWGNPIQIKYAANRYLPTDWIRKYNKISAGELIHEALSHVYVAEDIDFASKQMYLLGYIPEDYIPTLKQHLKKVVSLEKVKGWYTKDWDIRNEREIISQEGIVLRPDRIMIKEDSIIVVDYKTGQVNSKNVYQVQAYVRALLSMNEQQVKGYLYYLQSRDLQEVLIE